MKEIEDERTRKYLERNKSQYWILRGYKDAEERKPYKRAPAPTPPESPDEYLPKEWQIYLEGWNAGVKDVSLRMSTN